MKCCKLSTYSQHLSNAFLQGSRTEWMQQLCLQGCCELGPSGCALPMIWCRSWWCPGLSALSALGQGPGSWKVFEKIPQPETPALGFASGKCQLKSNFQCTGGWSTCLFCDPLLAGASWGVQGEQGAEQVLSCLLGMWMVHSYRNEMQSTCKIGVSVNLNVARGSVNGSMFVIGRKCAWVLQAGSSGVGVTGCEIISIHSLDFSTCLRLFTPIKNKYLISKFSILWQFPVKNKRPALSDSCCGSESGFGPWRAKKR